MLNFKFAFRIALWSCLPFFVAGCSGGPEKPAAQLPKVSVAHPVPRELHDFAEFNGWMSADKVSLRSRVRGHIDKVLFTDGEMVDVKQPLFKLDQRPFQSEIDRAKERVNIADAQLFAAKRELARQVDLFKKGASTQAQVDKCEADAKTLDAQVASSENEVARAELELSYANITSPIKGRVGKAELTEGNLVNAGGTDPILTTIVAVSPIKVDFSVDERTLYRFAKNYGGEGKSLTAVLTTLKDREAPFLFALDGETDYKHTGKLRFGDNQVNNRTGTLPVYGDVENLDGRYLPGTRVRVRLTVGKAYQALLVPEAAILADQDQRYVLVLGKDNNVRRQNVTLGRLTDDKLRAIQPAQKLTDGEKPSDWWVLVDNLQRARLNYPVEPLKEPASAE